ncbi:MAG TPA: 50S ribosomal protein L10 [Methanobacterium subterraneum]|jgi:large subunit ribosomal protein L10|uniref:Large ribosomal subunit protein uL10 n=1 Tax=Methanobacterium subterraneum TaxID=59277 RepID=A0A2H4VMC8_9EURY|nr:MULTISPECIES: 50S ribosomal protein L10 [Methanobacterium]AUB58274.1 50S ribosomal protein L10 [Methanobacterium sp. MZ-A1]AUB59253.1 50S ribosomal protein L10 [Methanobacterium subterraneum]MBW4256929.1 50S ribosomal protein L10 [Methanobacterium sp. YSL]HII83879.1 50S ribosomal protein L10 [Methanobacterium subterraneum]
MPHVAEWKKEEVKELKDMIESHPVVGMADLSDIPAPQLQKMRQSLRGSAKLKMSRKTLMDLALNDSGKSNVEVLIDHMDGQPALIFTDMNPFKLYKILEGSKTPAPAKAGSIAIADIVVPKGDTGFMPGPILGELQKVGIPAKIEKGKIVITEDKTIVAEGEEISRDVASMLTRLDIYPMEVGIDLKAAYEDETVYTSDILFIDEEETISDIQKAYTRALNLSVNAVVFNSASTPVIISKAAGEALNLAFNAEVLTSKTTDLLLAKAYSQMLAVASEASAQNAESVDDELREKLNATASAAAAQPAEEEKEEEEEEEEEEDNEEDAAAGLGALFG